MKDRITPFFYFTGNGTDDCHMKNGDFAFWSYNKGILRTKRGLVMAERIFKRKIYDKMMEWKRESDGSTALLIKGARRVGKSTIALEFARREYETYLCIDFSSVSKEINGLFSDMSDLNFFFLRLQLLTNTELRERKSVIIFDEVIKRINRWMYFQKNIQNVLWKSI